MPITWQVVKEVPDLFCDRALLPAVGTHEQHYKWFSNACALGLFACAVTGKEAMPHESIVPAHVRRITFGSGTSRKGEHNIIPMLNSVHQEEHRAGERAVLRRFVTLACDGWTKEQVKRYFEARAIKYAGYWAREVLSRVLQLDLTVLNSETIAALDVWAAEHNIMLYSEAQTCKT